MIQMTELMAKSLSLEELAMRLRDHDEPGVRVFAERVIKQIDERDEDSESELF